VRPATGDRLLDEVVPPRESGDPVPERDGGGRGKGGRHLAGAHGPAIEQTRDVFWGEAVSPTVRDPQRREHAVFEGPRQCPRLEGLQGQPQPDTRPGVPGLLSITIHIVSNTIRVVTRT